MNPDGSTWSKGFQPIPELQIASADLMLVFLSANDIGFVEPSNDDWYSAHVSLPQPYAPRDAPGQLSLYYRDDPVRVLGCTSHYQYCNPNLEPDIGCTPLAGMLLAQGLGGRLWQTEQQRAKFEWSAAAIQWNSFTPPEILYALGASALTGRYKLAHNVQAPLPDNQWQLEAEHWFKIILADLQRTIVEHATGPVDENAARGLIRPRTAEERSVCRNQVCSLCLCAS